MMRLSSVRARLEPDVDVGTTLLPRARRSFISNIAESLSSLRVKLFSLAKFRRLKFRYSSLDEGRGKL